MISEKQLEANRKNAQKSTGPKTALGKAVVSGPPAETVFTKQTHFDPPTDDPPHSKIVHAQLVLCGPLRFGLSPLSPARRNQLNFPGPMELFLESRAGLCDLPFP